MNSSDRIVQKIRIPTEIPTEYVEIEVNTSREELSGLINRLITDEEFRIQFNKNPNKIFQDVGIFLDSATIKKLESSPITTMVRDPSPRPAAFAALVVVPSVVSAGVVVIVIVGTALPPAMPVRHCRHTGKTELDTDSVPGQSHI